MTTDCKVNKKSIYLILALCIIPIIVCVISNISLVYAFTLALISTIVILQNNGVKIQEIKTMIIGSILDCKELYCIILLIGVNVSIWLSSGIVPTIMYYGLQKLSGVNFLFASFLLISVTSIFMGTAFGTISTIGLALLGLGKGFGVPTPILVGVIISGAFLADKISPISGLLNLNIKTTEVLYKKALKTYMYTLIPSLIICAVAYYIMGSDIHVSNSSKDAIEIMKTVKTSFVISPYFLLIPLLTIVLSIKGIKSLYCLLISVVVGGLISIFIQQIPINQFINFSLFGYTSHTSSTIVNNILAGGGLFNMISTVFIIFGSVSISTMLQETGVIRYLTKDIVDKIKDRKSLILKTSIISSLLTILTCDQTAGIIIPPELLKPKYKEFGFDNSVLSRTISDTSTIIAPVIPWNINAVVISLVTGVSCVSYMPYAILCFIMPVITIIVAYIYNKK